MEVLVIRHSCAPYLVVGVISLRFRKESQTSAHWTQLHASSVGKWDTMQICALTKGFLLRLVAMFYLIPTQTLPQAHMVNTLLIIIKTNKTITHNSNTETLGHQVTSQTKFLCGVEIHSVILIKFVLLNKNTLFCIFII